MLDAYRLGHIEIEELEDLVVRSRSELEPLQEELLAISDRQAHAGRQVGKLTNAQALLDSLREKVAAIVEPAEKRSIIEALVQSIEVATDGQGHRKTAEVHVTYRFEPSSSVEYSTP